MNESPEMFKKSDLERTVKLLSDNKYYQIKSEISKGLNFFKKVSKGKLNTTMELDSKLSNKYNSNVDIENNLIVLTDKFNENRNIIFVELTHSGQSSLNLYQTLIKTMNPGLVLIEQEPYVEGSNKFDNFQDLNNFKKFIKDFSESNLEIKNNHVINNSVDALSEVESIILNSLTPSGMSSNSKKKVVLFDVPYHNYFKSFLHFSKLDPKLNSQDKLISIRDKLTCLNLFEINNWLSNQETLGCKTCASFFNKREVNWYPLHLEFLVNKNTLPNSSYVRNFKINKIFNSIKEEKENVLIFASNTKQLCYDFLQYTENSKSDNQFEFDDYFDSKELNSDYNSEILSLAFLLKENFKKFYKSPPIKVNCTDLSLLKNKMANDFEHIYLINNELEVLSSELSKFSKEESSSDEISSNQIKRKSFIIGKNSTARSSGDKLKSCEPNNFINTTLEYKNIFLENKH
jgi:hypothetical protein